MPAGPAPSQQVEPRKSITVYERTECNQPSHQVARRCQGTCHVACPDSSAKPLLPVKAAALKEKLIHRSVDGFGKEILVRPGEFSQGELPF